MIPVILIHSGIENYLYYSIGQACKNNRVYLIGTDNPNIDNANFNFEDIHKYSQYLEEFKQIYVHLNTTPYKYELFCYFRWFILRNFMESNNIDKVFYIDSDVLLFSDITKEWAKYNQFDMTLLHRTAPISSYMTLKGLNNFCNMLVSVYNNKDGYDFKKIESHYLVRRHHNLPGGVCDMTLFEYFHYHAQFGGGPGRVGEMMHIYNDATYDHNINAEDQDFEFDGQKKVIKIKDKLPYVLNKKLNKDILFNSIHFQGSAKSYMGYIYERCN